MFRLDRRDAVLGIASKPKKYDLPLDKDQGNLFLLILIALMCFLGLLSLSGSFILSAMEKRWTSGLKGKATVEITAQDEVQREQIAQRALALLTDHPAVARAQKLEEEAIAGLLQPWFGNDIGLDNLPLPVLLNIELKPDVGLSPDILQKQLHDISPAITLDTHQSWLDDVLRFTGALSFAALCLNVIVLCTTIIAISGAIQARMAVYHEELELLHLMGASDRYIVGQIERYVFLLALKGAMIGGVAGGLAVIIIGFFAGRQDINLVPDFEMTGMHWTVLCFVPVILSLLATLTASMTARKALQKMV